MTSTTQGHEPVRALVVPLKVGMAMLGVSKKKMRQAMANPRRTDIPMPFKMGSRWVFRPADITEYVEAKARAANAHRFRQAGDDQAAGQAA
jgi:hypothetical protein